ncbi:TPA: hypothetical protein L9301_002687 [Klebsiella aerogenes]|nr:hypothetical protein [Klebsiella aerogenes]
MRIDRAVRPGDFGNNFREISKIISPRSAADIRRAGEVAASAGKIMALAQKKLISSF